MNGGSLCWSAADETLCGRGEGPGALPPGCAGREANIAAKGFAALGADAELVLVVLVCWGLTGGGTLIPTIGTPTVHENIYSTTT